MSAEYVGEVVTTSSTTELVPVGILTNQMGQIRPAWKSKGLLERVYRLIPVDPSSACQRLLNASIADLREKIVIAGVDIAADVAKANKLPAISNEEDVERYSTHRIINLSYHMGLLDRAQWRRMLRSYEIRRDLEHEDISYEAGIEDCVYIFTTCIDAVLSRDPITVIRASEVREVIESAGPVSPEAGLLTDYESAPEPRQLEISQLLYATAVNEFAPDVVRQNAYSLAKQFAPLTKAAVTVKLAAEVQKKLERTVPNPLEMRVACANGTLPYLKKTQRRAFFQDFYQRIDHIGFHWSKNLQHADLLREFQEYGGFQSVPEEESRLILKWMLLLYLGEPGGRGMGRSGPVFFSNSGAPAVEQLLQQQKEIIRSLVVDLQEDPDICSAVDASPHIARRMQSLLDLAES